MREGVVNEEVFRIFVRNSRFPDMMRGDLKVIMAGCALGKQRLEEVARRFGAPAVLATFDHLLARSEQAMRRALETRVADGTDALYYVAQENYPVEFAELEFGVRTEAFRIHADSGGPGRWRGGSGTVRDVRILAEEAEIALRMDNCRFPAFGVNGDAADEAAD